MLPDNPSTIVQSRTHLSPQMLTEYCQKHHIREFAFFGSVLRDDFGPDSDLDVLVDFEPGVRVRFADLSDMETELTHLIGRKVDLVEKNAILKSPNYLRRRYIIQGSQIYYATR